MTDGENHYALILFSLNETVIHAQAVCTVHVNGW